MRSTLVIDYWESEGAADQCLLPVQEGHVITSVSTSGGGATLTKGTLSGDDAG